MTSKLAQTTVLIAINLMLVTGFCAAHKIYEEKRIKNLSLIEKKEIPQEKNQSKATKKSESQDNGIEKLFSKILPKTNKDGVSTSTKKILARVTVYWAKGSGTDPWSAKKMSSTGTKLQCGAHAAVDPKVIPYGSKLKLSKGNKELVVKAVDTGSHVKKRKAAIAMAKTNLEKQAPVVDLFFEHKSAALAYARNNPHFQWVKVYPPEANM